MTSGPPPGATDRGAVFWASAAAGWAVIASGVAGILRHHVDTRPADLVRFVAGGILLHDLVAVPLALLAAAVVTMAVPRRWRPWAQAALVITVTLSLFAYPLVRGYGRIPGNPSALPHDYGAHLALACAAVVALIAIVALIAVKRRRRPQDPALAPDTP